ncbi:fimbrial protein [Salmonella enterica]
MNNRVFNSQSSGTDDCRRVRMMLMSAAVLCTAALVSPAGMASELMLPALPAGCHYTHQALLPVQGTFRVEPGTPLYGAVGPQQSPLLQVSLQCDGPLSAPLTLALKSGEMQNWQGPGRDVLPTVVRDTGLRLSVQGEARGGNCSPAGWLGAGTGDWQCTLPVGGEGTRTLSLQVGAQVVKTGKNTPVQSTQALRPVNGDIRLSVNGSPVSLTGTGAIAPQVATTPACTIESGKNDTINFGTVSRSENLNPLLGTVLSTMPQTISVSCTPQPDGGKPYEVSVKFKGEISDIYTHGFAAAGALKTSISDLFIRATTPDNGGSPISLKGEAFPLTLDSATQRYRLNVNWELAEYRPASVPAPEEYGAFDATAAYTVEVN